MEASACYGGTGIRSAEQARDEQQKARVLELRNRFVDGPVLLVPSGGHTRFNAMDATPVPEEEVFVLPYRTKGEWGMLKATNSTLVYDDGTRRLPGPFV